MPLSHWSAGACGGRITSRIWSRLAAIPKPASIWRARTTCTCKLAGATTPVAGRWRLERAITCVQRSGSSSAGAGIGTRLSPGRCVGSAGTCPDLGRGSLTTAPGRRPRVWACARRRSVPCRSDRVAEQSPEHPTGQLDRRALVEHPPGQLRVLVQVGLRVLSVAVEVRVTAGARRAWPARPGLRDSASRRTDASWRTWFSTQSIPHHSCTGVASLSVVRSATTSGMKSCSALMARPRWADIASAVHVLRCPSPLPVYDRTTKPEAMKACR